MPIADQPIYEALRRFDQLDALDQGQLDVVAGAVQIAEAEPGTCLLELGSADSRLLYLIRGELELIADDGGVHRIRERDAAARGPVSRLRPSRYRVIARSPVRYLRLDRELLERVCAEQSASSLLVDERYTVGEANELLDPSATHPLMFDVFDDLNHRRILVPSDAAVAVRVGRALGAVDLTPARAAQLLALCPALTLKALRTARREAPRRGSAITTCRQVVDELGVERLYQLTVNCVLRESLRTQSHTIGERMQQWWRHTMRLAAIARVLAQRHAGLDPNHAEVVGLLHGIAEAVMLGYADRHRDLIDSLALDNVLHGNRAELGRILLYYWGMPQTVIDAAAMCNNWSYSHRGDVDYTDVLLVAQWHALIGSDRGHALPRTDTVPAFERLGLAAPSPRLSLKIVDAADSAVERADALLSSH